MPGRIAWQTRFCVVYCVCLHYSGNINRFLSIESFFSIFCLQHILIHCNLDFIFSLFFVFCMFLVVLRHAIYFRSIPAHTTRPSSLRHCHLWRYAEEVLRSGSAIWMSSDGYLMLYGTFNDTHVEEQKFTWYGAAESANGNGNLYPEIRSLRYEYDFVCLLCISFVTNG